MGTSVPSFFSTTCYVWKAWKMFFSIPTFQSNDFLQSITYKTSIRLTHFNPHSAFSSCSELNHIPWGGENRHQPPDKSWTGCSSPRCHRTMEPSSLEKPLGPSPTVQPPPKSPGATFTQICITTGRTQRDRHVFYFSHKIIFPSPITTIFFKPCCCLWASPSK